MEIRMARLEGACEQISDRLNSIEHTMDSRFAQVDTRFAQLDRKIDSNLRTIITWMLGQTAVILGAVAAFAFHR